MTDQNASLRSIRNGESLCIRVAGPVGGENLSQLDRQIRPLLENACQRVCLDLTMADYLDSDGTRWLQSIQGALESRGAELGVAVRAGSRVDRTVTLLHLEAMFAISRETEEPSQDTALAF